MIPALLLAAGSPAFAPIERLVGHCWRGPLAGGARDTHCFARKGDTVVDRHVVTRRGNAVYRGETHYTLADGRLRWAYRNDDGPVMAGEVAGTPDGVRFTVDDGAPLVWRWRGPRAYEAQVGPQGAVVRFVRVR